MRSPTSELQGDRRRPRVAEPRNETRIPRAAVLVHGLTLAVGAVVLGVLARGQWFFGDEWDPIAQRSVFGDAEKGLLEPHNEHWSTVAVVVYRAHLAVFGLRTYVPLMVLFVIVCLATAHAIWRSCLRMGADPYVASALVLGVLLYGPAGSELVFAWNFTFVGALGCGFAILALVPSTGPTTSRDRWVVWGFGLAGITLSGVALTMLAVVGMALWWSRGWRVVAEALSVPVGVYALWALGWGRDGGSLLSAGGLEQVPDVVGTGLTVAFDDLSGVGYTGALVLVALGAYTLATWRSWTGLRSWALCCAVGAIVFYVIVAVRRDSPFLPGPTTGRYLWMAFALLVPLVALAITALVRQGRVVAVGAACLAAVVLVLQVHDLVDAAGAARDLKAAERRRVVAGAQLAAAGLPAVEDSVLASSAVEDSARTDLLVRLARDGDLPRARPSAQDRLGARADLQVALDTWPDDAVEAPAPIVGTLDAAVTPAGEGCVAIASTGPATHLRFAPSADATTAARIVGTNPPSFGVAVVRNGTTGPWRPIIPFTAQPYRVRFAAADTEVLVTTGSGRLTVCNVTVDPAVLAPGRVDPPVTPA